MNNRLLIIYFIYSLIIAAYFIRSIWHAIKNFRVTRAPIISQLPIIFATASSNII